MKTLIRLLLVYFCSIATIYAQESSLVTDRPGQTECVNTVGEGSLQIESGFLFQSSQIARNTTQQRYTYPSSLFKLGLTEKFELRIIAKIVNYKNIRTDNWEKLGSISGMENLIIGLKRELKTEGKLQLSATAHIITPNGTEGISNERYGLLSRLNFNYGIDEEASLAGGVGYENYNLRFADGEGLVRDSDGQLFYTLIYGKNINDKFTVFVENYASFEEFEDWTQNMDAGIIYLINPNLQLDYSFGWGINNVMNYHALGISIRIPNSLQK
ncbi:MAG: hypothetical protein CMO34_00205 [Verrucomicrobia bacterium]|nr:hypothetical protein [Verrucomicrobiota bacterium]